MPYEKHYTGIRDNIQVFFGNKNSENIYAGGDKTSDGDNNNGYNDRVQGKNGKFREIQPMSQDDGRTFSEQREMGGGKTRGIDKKDSVGKNIRRGDRDRKTDIFHSGRYDVIENEAFVTGFASYRRRVFPPVAPQKETGLRTSGSINHAVVQRYHATLRDGDV